MRILLVTFEYKPVENGITISIERIARNLSNEGLEIHIISFSNSKSNSLFNKEVKLDTEIVNKKLFVHRISPYSGNMQYPSPQELQDMVFFIEKLHKKYNFDIIHGFRLIPGGFAAVIASKLLKIPCVVSIRGNDIGRNIYDSNLFSMNKYVLENADKLTFVASDLLELANTIVPIKKKAKVIHNSFDIKSYMYLKKEPKLLLKGKVIGTSGVIRQKKGFVYMIKAFKEYIKKNDATFLLVGDFKSEEKLYYESIVKPLGKRFVKTGLIEHKYVLNFMKFIDIFLLTSLTEGCSNAMLEAMYLKIPIIATNVGAARDILNNNEILIEPRNSKEIFRSISMIKSNTKSFDYLDKFLRPRVEINNFIELYRKLL